ncbi:MAG: alanine--tRNA ligase [Planctomycetaceae bacterium]|nr:MAG: alanine--tRNA ligase [Planctomycetaceae bacterium]
MKTDELREKYLAFFQSKGHRRQPSDVLVPTWDPSVLFTPAGMNQFKDHFLGKVKLEFTRATTCQKCLRTGDIENVGRTAYHHTFFEMLGNFSFGDYFKRETILWAWEFLTDKQWLGIDPDRLTVSVYLNDDQAAEIWQRDVGLLPERIERMDEFDNFWPAGAPSEGPDGVCGPCSEIFYHDDFGDSVEIWNLVFTQFHRVGDPPDNLRPLPSKNIDTGMGLERAAACLQGVRTNYHIDILRPIVDAAAEVCGTQYEFGSDAGRRLRRITDHIRACAMAVHENVYPGPQKEKYVIRRLLRRAVLDGHHMGLRDPFLYQLVPAVVQAMKIPYPELEGTVGRVMEVIRNEEANFFGTIDAGLARIEKIFDEMKSANRTTVDGSEAADLYQTYGVPPEVFETLAAENNLAFDWDGYRRAMTEHGQASGKVVHTVMGDRGPIDAVKKVLHETEFLGYDAIEAQAELRFIVAQGQLCDHLAEQGHDKEIILILNSSPFYGESGGQVGDSGEIVGSDFRFLVRDTQKNGSLLLHHGHLVEGELRTGTIVTARVDASRRQGIRRAHSATHILHHALQKNLGSHAQQQGSKVDQDWLRFDFTNMAPVSTDQLAAIERDVNTRIVAAEPIEWRIVPLAEARQAGAMMLFGEKYPDPVRMVTMGDFSRELCGGTHLDNTNDVGPLEIVGEEAVAAGVRRIIALTGDRAQEYLDQTRSALTEAARILGTGLREVPEAACALIASVRDLRKLLASGGALPDDEPQAPPSSQDAELSAAQIKAALREAARALNVAPFDVPQRLAALKNEAQDLRRQIGQLAQSGDLTADGLLERAETIGETKVIVTETPGINPNLMRQWIDQIRKKSDSTAVLFGTVMGDDKVTLIAGISRDLVQRGLRAGDWVRDAAQVVGGGGGGKPDMAQAGGKLPEKLPEAIELAKARIRELLTAVE